MSGGFDAIRSVRKESIMSRKFYIDGNVTNDFHARGGTASLTKEGILFTDSAGSFLQPTEREPQPGGKVNSAGRLDDLLKTRFVTKSVIGGGAARASAALAVGLRATGNGDQVHLVNPGPASGKLTAWGNQCGVIVHSFDVVPTPRAVIVDVGGNRVIVREPAVAHANTLDVRQFGALTQELPDARAVASVSPKDRTLAAAALALGGGPRYFQPGPALGSWQNKLLAVGSHCVVGNLDDFAALAQAANLPQPTFTEQDEDAHNQTAALLVELQRLGVAGRELSICTLGRRGSVVIDWFRGQVHQIKLASGNQEVPTPAGAGDVFLAYLILYREGWAAAGHLRDPDLAAVIRATHAVARKLGLRGGEYEVSTASSKM
jgi:sugar/nucleoside kinase (ribokinase family)